MIGLVAGDRHAPLWVRVLIVILARPVLPIGSLSHDFYPHSPRIGPKDRRVEIDEQLAIPLRLEFLGEGFGPVGILPVS
jgi:hypothetical protein